MCPLLYSTPPTNLMRRLGAGAAAELSGPFGVSVVAVGMVATLLVGVLGGVVFVSVSDSGALLFSGDVPASFGSASSRF